MKKLILLTIILIGSIKAQIPDFMQIIDDDSNENKQIICSHLYKLHHKYDKTLATGWVARHYDVLEYNLFLDWYPPFTAPVQMTIDSVTNPLLPDTTLFLDHKWWGRNSIKLKIDSAVVSTIELNAFRLVIDSVFVDGQILKQTPQPQGSNLSIQLPSIAKQGDTIVIDIYYTHVTQTNNWGDGFFLYPEGFYVGLLPPPFYTRVEVEERLAYTQGEPESARAWMPCNDNPNDKAYAKISVRLPKGYNCASNGLLKSTENLGNSVVYHWEEQNPITTYLMAVAASRFRIISQWYHKISNPSDSIEIQNYIWNSDYLDTSTDGSWYNAKRFFSTNIDQVSYFSKIFGEYPHEKYGNVVLQPYIMGGMEHQSINFINRVWLRTNAQYGLAHELAHQWLGDQITCATWKDIWINEGGATWSEALWAEHLYGMNSYYSVMVNKANSYMKGGGVTLPPIYDLPMEQLFHINLTYNKSAWVYHMLRMMLGDSVFFPALQNLIKKHSGKSIVTQDYIDTFEEFAPNPPVPYKTYFAQWLKKAGHPIYELDAIVKNGANGYDVKVKINQIQEGENIPEIFVVPLPLLFYGPDNAVFSGTLINNQREQIDSFEVPFIPDSILVDTRKLLCELRSSITSVKEINNNEQTLTPKIIPNPLKRGQEGSFIFNVKDEGYFDISIYSILGEKVADIYKGHLSNGAFQFSFQTINLSQGSYFVYIKSQKQNIAMVIKVHS